MLYHDYRLEMVPMITGALSYVPKKLKEEALKIKN